MVLLGCLALRELLQMFASLKRYLLSLENWLELLLLSLLSYLLFAPEDAEDCSCQTGRHVAAVAILLAWTEFVLLVARHPRLARYNVYSSMFIKVLRTFLSFLLWYSLFLMAFAFGFYIMLHKDFPGFDAAADPDHYVYFDGPWTSLVKTITMFVGELEFSDIPIDPASRLSWLSFSFLVVFVFLIVVILMNLLNGLAVSDTGVIMEQAEIVSYISRVETISHLEAVLLGDPFDFLAAWPPASVLARLPALALCHQVPDNLSFHEPPSCTTLLTSSLETLPAGVLPVPRGAPGRTRRHRGHRHPPLLQVPFPHHPAHPPLPPHPPPLHSLLPDKKMVFPQEEPGEVCGVCRVRPVEDIPRDIMDAVRCKQKNKQTTSSQYLTLASRSLVLKESEEEDKVERMQRQLDRVEAQLATLIALAKDK